nr:EOG090X09AY [Sida crystallina]
MSAQVEDPQVLSIQSHVVSGHVGNTSAVFPLQVLGFEVHAINSVQFSNHTGYGKWTGTVMNSKELDDLMQGLKSNHLDNFTHILTGYVGDRSFLEQVHQIIKELKQKNPNTIYVCDPVMGDNGHLYVPEELLSIYRDLLIPLADVITPNQFEAELLTGKKIESESDALECMKLLHGKGAKTVVISSSVLGAEGRLTAFGSIQKPRAGTGGEDEAEGRTEAWKIDMSRLPHLFTGTGDLFAALLLAWLHRCPGNLARAMERSIDTLQAVLKTTSDYAESRMPSAGEVNRTKLLELRLVQSKKYMEDPPQTFTAVPLS